MAWIEQRYGRIGDEQDDGQPQPRFGWELDDVTGEVRGLYGLNPHPWDTCFVEATINGVTRRIDLPPETERFTVRFPVNRRGTAVPHETRVGRWVVPFEQVIMHREYGRPQRSSPVVLSVTSTAGGSDSTSHSISLGPTWNSGDLVVIKYSHAKLSSETANAPSTPAGFTLAGGGNDGEFMYGRSWAKDATGSEDGTSVTSTTPSATIHLAQVYRIEAGSHAGASNVDTGTFASGSGTAPNPPSVTSPTGAGSHLYIAACALANDASINTAPANFTNLTTHDTGGAEDVAMGTARRIVAGSSLDPGAFAAEDEDWLAWTTVVPEAPAGGGEEAEGGSTADVTANAQAGGRKNGRGSGTADISVNPQGAGRKASSGGSTAEVEVDAAGTGRKSVSSGATASASVNTQGAGAKQVASSSEAAVEVDTEAAGFKNGQSGSTAGITVDSQGDGVAEVNEAEGGSTAVVSVDVQGTGTKDTSSSSEAEVEVDASGGGFKNAAGSDTAGVSVDSQGAGTKDTSGAGQAPVVVDAQGNGSKATSGSSTAEVEVDATGAGTSFPGGGSTAVVSVSAEGAGAKDTSGSSEAQVEVDSEGNGSKQTSGASEIEVSVDTTGQGRKNSRDASTANIEVDADALGQKNGEGASQSEVTASSTGQGFKQGMGGTESNISVGGDGHGTKTTSGASTADVLVDAQGFGSSTDPFEPSIILNRRLRGLSYRSSYGVPARNLSGVADTPNGG